MSMAHGHAGEENTDGCRTYEYGFVWIEEIHIMERSMVCFLVAFITVQRVCHLLR